MKFTIERASLLKTLGHVQSVVERRNTIPILANVLLQAQNGALSITATDMDLTIVDRVECVIETTGSTTLSAHTLYDIVRKLPDGLQVELSLNEQGTEILLSAGRSRFSLATLPIDDYPATSDIELPHRFELDVDDLKRAIDQTSFAVSTEETRYYLNGIYLHYTDEDRLRSVATDGHRLARVEFVAPKEAKDIPGIIIPRKAVAQLRKLIEETDFPILISLSETTIRFSFGSVILTSKLIDGSFPDYERVVPTSNDKSLILSAALLAQAVDRVSTISTDKGRAIKLHLSSGSLLLSASSPDQSHASEELEVPYEGDSVEIGFNARYLLDVLQQLSQDKIEILFADANAPVVIKDIEDPTALFVLMPMRV